MDQDEAALLFAPPEGAEVVEDPEVEEVPLEDVEELEDEESELEDVEDEESEDAESDAEEEVSVVAALFVESVE